MMLSFYPLTTEEVIGAFYNRANTKQGLTDKQLRRESYRPGPMTEDELRSCYEANTTFDAVTNSVILTVSVIKGRVVPLTIVDNKRLDSVPWDRAYGLGTAEKIIEITKQEKLKKGKQ